MATYVTLLEAKDHIRVDHEDDDIYITQLLDVCETSILNEIRGRVPGKGLVDTNATTTLVGDDSCKFVENIKAGDLIYVYGESVRTVSSITDNTHLVVSSAFSTTDTDLSFEIQPSPLESGVLPIPLKHAMLMLIGHLYNNREPVVMGVSAVKIPMTIEYLIAPYKYYSVG